MNEARGRLWSALILAAGCLLLAGVTPAWCEAPATTTTDLAEDELARREEQALEDWGSGRYTRSVAGWRLLIAAEPTRRRYRLGLVRTLVSAGAVRRARQELLKAASVPALDRSDEYNTLVAEGEVLRAEQEGELAVDAFDEAAALAGRDSRARSGSGLALRGGSRPWQLNAGMIVDHFDNARGLESQLLFELGYRYSSTLATYLLYEQHNRFDATDHVYLAGVSLRPNEYFALRLDAGGSPDPAFRPELEGSARVEWLLTEMLHPLLAYQILDYAEGRASTWTPGLRILAESASVELQYALTEEIDGSNTRTGGLRLDWSLAPHWAPTLTYHRGEEALPPQSRAKFQRAGAGLTWLASREWQLRLDYAYEDREAAYIGHSLALGVGLNF